MLKSRYRNEKGSHTVSHLVLALLKNSKNIIYTALNHTCHPYFYFIFFRRNLSSGSNSWLKTAQLDTSYLLHVVNVNATWSFRTDRTRAKAILWSFLHGVNFDCIKLWFLWAWSNGSRKQAEKHLKVWNLKFGTVSKIQLKNWRNGFLRFGLFCNLVPS